MTLKPLNNDEKVLDDDAFSVELLRSAPKDGTSISDVCWRFEFLSSLSYDDLPAPPEGAQILGKILLLRNLFHRVQNIPKFLEIIYSPWAKELWDKELEERNRLELEYHDRIRWEALPSRISS